MENREAERPCLTKVTTPPPIWESLCAKLSDRERVRSDLKDVYPGILKEEEEVRPDSWIQIMSGG